MGGRNNGNGYNQTKNFSNDNERPKIQKVVTPNYNRNSGPQNASNGSINNKK